MSEHIWPPGGSDTQGEAAVHSLFEEEINHPQKQIGSDKKDVLGLWFFVFPAGLPVGRSSVREINKRLGRYLG